MSDNEVSELKNILVNSVKEQKLFNRSIEKKIDRVQYFLELASKFKLMQKI